MNADIHIIVRANSESSRKKMLLAGAHEVVLPFTISGQKVAQRIINPDMEDFLHLPWVTSGDDDCLQLIDINIKANSPLEGKTLKTCGLRRDGLIVVGMKTKEGSFEFAPDADRVFKVDDCLVALGTPSSYEKVKSFLSIDQAS